MKYAGFWRRLLASMIDIILFFIFYKSIVSLNHNSTIIEVFLLVLINLGFPFFIVYFNAKYGMSPGKFVARIRITNLDGNPIGYKEALLRSSIDLILGFVGLLTLLIARFQISNAEDYLLLPWLNKSIYLQSLAPKWNNFLLYISFLWLCSELIVLLLNKKKRALHDFIAGTVVIHVKFFDEKSKSDSTNKNKIAAVALSLLCSILFIFGLNSSVFENYFLSIEMKSKKEIVLATLNLSNSEYYIKENGVIAIQCKSQYSGRHLEKGEWADTRFELIFENGILFSIKWLRPDNSLVEEKTNRIFIPLH